jgi:hypothetical protein
VDEDYVTLESDILLDTIASDNIIDDHHPHIGRESLCNHVASHWNKNVSSCFAIAPSFIWASFSTDLIIGSI